MEVRDSLLLLLVVGFCVGLVSVVIVGVRQGAGTCMVSSWCRSNLREKCVIGVKNVCGMLVTCEGFIRTWVMCNCTYVWAHIIQLPLYTWVSCSSHRGMYGEACVHYGCWSIDTMVPSLFSASCMWRHYMYVLWCPELFVHIVKHHCKVTSRYIISYWALRNRWYYNNNCAPTIIFDCNVKWCGNALFSY
jgi:hypothetical protein